MTNIGTAVFNSASYEVLLLAYPGGRPALQLVDAEGEPEITATINLPDEPLEEGEIILKTYAEGQGIDVALVDAGLIHPPHRQVRAGYTTAAVARLRITVP